MKSVGYALLVGAVLLGAVATILFLTGLPVSDLGSYTLLALAAGAALGFALGVIYAADSF
ncbi:MAG: hypothetical protein WAN74_07805 [Thermoplasmata archaeon]